MPLRSGGVSGATPYLPEDQLNDLIYGPSDYVAPAYDPAQDTQGMQAQPTALAPATPEAAATSPEASYAYGTGQGYYDTGVAPAESTVQTTAQPIYEPAPQAAPAQEAAPAPAPAPAPYGPPASQGYTAQVQTAPASAPAPAASESYATAAPAATPAPGFGGTKSRIDPTQPASLQGLYAGNVAHEVGQYQGARPAAAPPRSLGVGAEAIGRNADGSYRDRPLSSPGPSPWVPYQSPSPFQSPGGGEFAGVPAVTDQALWDVRARAARERQQGQDRYGLEGYGQTGYGQGAGGMIPRPGGNEADVAAWNALTAPPIQSGVSPDVRFAPRSATPMTPWLQTQAELDRVMAAQGMGGGPGGTGVTTEDIANAQLLGPDPTVGPLAGDWPFVIYPGGPIAGRAARGGLTVEPVAGEGPYTRPVTEPAPVIAPEPSAAGNPFGGRVFKGQDGEVIQAPGPRPWELPPEAPAGVEPSRAAPNRPRPAAAPAVLPPEPAISPEAAAPRRPAPEPAPTVLEDTPYLHPGERSQLDQARSTGDDATVNYLLTLDRVRGGAADAGTQLPARQLTASELQQLSQARALGEQATIDRITGVGREASTAEGLPLQTAGETPGPAYRPPTAAETSSVRTPGPTAPVPVEPLEAAPEQAAPQRPRPAAAPTVRPLEVAPEEAAPQRPRPEAAPVPEGEPAPIQQASPLPPEEITPPAQRPLSPQAERELQRVQQQRNQTEVQRAAAMREAATTAAQEEAAARVIERFRGAATAAPQAASSLASRLAKMGALGAGAIGAAAAIDAQRNQAGVKPTPTEQPTAPPTETPENAVVPGAPLFMMQPQENGSIDVVPISQGDIELGLRSGMQSVGLINPDNGAYTDLLANNDHLAAAEANGYGLAALDNEEFDALAAAGVFPTATEEWRKKLVGHPTLVPGDWVPYIKPAPPSHDIKSRGGQAWYDWGGEELWRRSQETQAPVDGTVPTDTNVVTTTAPDGTVTYTPVPGTEATVSGGDVFDTSGGGGYSDSYGGGGGGYYDDSGSYGGGGSSVLPPDFMANFRFRDMLGASGGAMGGRGRRGRRAPRAVGRMGRGRGPAPALNFPAGVPRNPAEEMNITRLFDLIGGR